MAYGVKIQFTPVESFIVPWGFTLKVTGIEGPFTPFSHTMAKEATVTFPFLAMVPVPVAVRGFVGFPPGRPTP